MPKSKSTKGTTALEVSPKSSDVDAALVTLLPTIDPKTKEKMLAELGKGQARAIFDATRQGTIGELVAAWTSSPGWGAMKDVRIADVFSNRRADIVSERIDAGMVGGPGGKSRVAPSAGFARVTDELKAAIRDYLTKNPGSRTVAIKDAVAGDDELRRKAVNNALNSMKAKGELTIKGDRNVATYTLKPLSKR